MTPEAQRRFLSEPTRPWGTNLSSFPMTTVEHSLIQMVEFGVRQVTAGHKDGLRFDVFNIAEANFCGAYMRQHHPDIPFSTTRIV